jgi:putative drug exporter of the RND superfamily
MERLLEHWGRVVARWPLVIILAWVAVVVVAFHFSPSLSTVADQQNLSSLPSNAPSVRADQLYTTKFVAGQLSANKEEDVLVLADPRGISDADVALTQQIAAWLTAPATRPAHLQSVVAPNAQAPLAAFESTDHQALRMMVIWDTTNDNALQDSVSKIDSYLAHLSKPADVTVGILGGAPVTYDFFANLFSSMGPGVLITLLIILVVLAFVYRSPLAVIIPLISIGMAFALSISVLAWLGATINLPVETFSLEYVAFVLLGAGTNYGVFLLSRYREEMQRGAGAANDKAARREALARAVGRVGEAISSSAVTVMAATGVMGLAQLALLKVTGPAVAIAVLCLLLAGLTLLPALMALCGRAFFWPAAPKPGVLAGVVAPARGLWASAGRLVTKRPWAVTFVAVIVLAPLALSALTIHLSYDDLHSLPDRAPSIQAFNAENQHFNDVTQVQFFLSLPGHDLRASTYDQTLAKVASALTGVQHITSVQAPSSPNGQQQPTGSTLTPTQMAQFFATDGSAVQFTLSLDVAPNSPEAAAAVGAAYDKAHQVLQGTLLAGADVLAAGSSAYTYDEANQLSADFRLVVALACLAIYIILALLLRSLTAPIYLIATIALSAGTAIGLTNLIYHDILGKPLFYLVPLFAFIFLVSLGEDFNILTMARIREEVGQLGHRKGIAAAVALTGGVVSSCGLVMAASFSRGFFSSLLELGESGAAIFFGVLIDTFLVRPLLVPAIATLLGRWNWVWPWRKQQPHAKDKQELANEESEFFEEEVALF